MAFSVSTNTPILKSIEHSTIVPLYSALAMIVRFTTIVPAAVKVNESLTRSRGRDHAPNLKKVKPPASHVNTAVLFKRTVLLPGA